MKILIVDDSKAMRMIIIRSLKKAGFGEHDFLEADCGLAAIDSIKKNQPNLVLSDWNMPEMDGIELLQTVRTMGNQVTFGFITSEGSEKTRTLAQESGADFLLTKPVTVEMIEDALTPILSGC